MKLHKNAERKFSDVIRLNPQTKPHGYNLGFREAASSPAKGEMGRGLGKAGGREEGRESNRGVAGRCLTVCLALTIKLNLKRERRRKKHPFSTSSPCNTFYTRKRAQLLPEL